jgi:3-hydroxyacyl-CoA dehydrogenase/3a,7a,12a-trihydroxy-5b-cholest-24-enoyl-CoA hydratase
MSLLRFDGKVALVTGAGNGLGRAHALLLGSRGAKVVVNDLGGGHTGGGKSSAAADKVVEEIKALGGHAVANYDSVEDGDKIVKTALDAFGQLDIVINNAGILRDTSFQKMTQDDWDLIYRVHVLGAYRVTKAAWDHMRERGYGRIILTASAAGIYGNFGQTNYAMAKLGLVGFGQTLAIEGGKKNVFTNVIAPIAGSRMTETVLPKDLIDALKPEYVSALVGWLCHESCKENGGLFEVGGGFYSKLRWERTQGKTFKLGRVITPENVQSAWNDVTDFAKTTHPKDITSSMEPILANLGTKALGGNEFIDVDQALGYEFPPTNSKYDQRDVALYALGVGAAQNPLDEKELQYVYEMNGGGFNVLPTFGVVPALGMIFDLYKQGKAAPGMNYGFERVLHGEQYMEVLRPLPDNAKLTHKAKIKDIFDKGKNAIVVTEIRTFDESGDELVRNEVTTFVRGAGGWGGDRGPQGEVNVPPDRAPDATVTEKIGENQALLYRLSGDINPLHADPSFAKNFGFERPILHGLCTFGYAARHVIKSFSNNDPRLFKSIKARFSESVFPGETLVTEMWKESATRIVFRCKVKERDKVVLAAAAIELYTEVPKPKAKPAAAAATPAAASAGAPGGGLPSEGGMTSADLFWGIRHHVETNPDLAAKIGTVFQFKLTQPNAVWTLDLKNGKGSVAEGETVKPDCTIELTQTNFLGMATGKLNPQKMYFAGDMKITGNLMASQKLEFLKSIDPQKTRDAMKAAGYTPGTGGGAGGAASPTGAASEGGGSGDVFIAIADYITKNPDLVGSVGTVYQWKLTNPDSVWTMDLKNGKGSVTPGAGEKPDCTLELTESDFMDMTSGKADPQKMFFEKKLKISGNIMASQKLTFLKKMDPEQAKAAIAKAKAPGGAHAGAGAAAASAASKKEPVAEKFFAALGKRLTENPKLKDEVGVVMTWKVTGPDAVWTLDLKAGAVRQGADAAAATTLTIADEDLAELGKDGNLQALYQHGKVRLDGDVRYAQKLSFIKGII